MILRPSARRSGRRLLELKGPWRFQSDIEDIGRRVRLHFGRVHLRSTAWLNGALPGGNRIPYAPFGPYGVVTVDRKPKVGLRALARMYGVRGGRTRKGGSR